MFNLPTRTDLFQISPVMMIVFTIGLILVASLAFKEKISKRVLFGIAATGIGTAILFAVKLFPSASAALRNIPGSQSLFSDSILFDPLFLFMCVFLSVFVFGILVLSAALWKEEVWEWPIYESLLLGSLIGMILLASTRHLIFFVIAFELASVPSYVLVGFRKFNPKAAEGAAKYTIFGAVCSAVMVYGISLLYGLTGSFDFQKISLDLAGGPIQITEGVALLCILVGIGFKVSLVPMHFWSPDAFEAAGADIAAWLSVASKSAAIIALARWVQMLAHFTGSGFQQHLVFSLSALAIITMTIANLSAYWQSSVKRLLAYSSIAHAGYISCGVTVLSGTAGLAAVAAYIVVYMLMNLGAFAVAGLIEGQAGSDHLDNFSGLGARNPMLSVLMMFFLFSLVGLPPLAGFAVKWILISVLWANHLKVLVVAILANTLLSLFYYMRIARAMYFEASNLPAIRTPLAVNCMLTVCAAGLFVLFLGWGVLNRFADTLLFGLGR